MISSNNFDDIVKFVKRVARFNELDGWLTLKLGHHLNNAAEAILCECIKTKNDKKIGCKKFHLHPSWLHHENTMYLVELSERSLIENTPSGQK